MICSKEGIVLAGFMDGQMAERDNPADFPNLHILSYPYCEGHCNMVECCWSSPKGEDHREAGTLTSRWWRGVILAAISFYKERYDAKGR